MRKFRSSKTKKLDAEIEPLRQEAVLLDVVEHVDSDNDSDVGEIKHTNSHKLHNPPKFQPQGFPIATHRSGRNLKDFNTLKSSHPDNFFLEIAMINQPKQNSNFSSSPTSRIVTDRLDLSDVSKLKWTNPVGDDEIEQTKAGLPDFADNWKLHLLRFDLDGKLCSQLPISTLKEDTQHTAFHMMAESDPLFYHQGLHHHGNDPHLPGYTLPELAHLSLSTTPKQRLFALRALAEVLYQSRKAVSFMIGKETSKSKQKIMNSPDTFDKSLNLNSSILSPREFSCGFGFGWNRMLNYYIQDLKIVPIILCNIRENTNPSICSAALHLLSNLICYPISTSNLELIDHLLLPNSPSKNNTGKLNNSFEECEQFSSHLKQGSSLTFLNDLTGRPKGPYSTYFTTWEARSKQKLFSNDFKTMQLFSENLYLNFALHSLFPSNQNLAFISLDFFKDHSLHQALLIEFSKTFTPEITREKHKLLNIGCTYLEPTELQTLDNLCNPSTLISSLILQENLINDLLELLSPFGINPNIQLKLIINCFRIIMGCIVQSSTIAILIIRNSSFVEALIYYLKSNTTSSAIKYHIILLVIYSNLSLGFSSQYDTAEYYFERSAWLTFILDHFIPFVEDEIVSLLEDSITCDYFHQLKSNFSAEKSYDIIQQQAYFDRHRIWHYFLGVESIRALNTLPFDNHIQDISYTLFDHFTKFIKKIHNVLSNVDDLDKNQKNRVISTFFETDGKLIQQIFLTSISKDNYSLFSSRVSTLIHHAFFFLNFIHSNQLLENATFLHAPQELAFSALIFIKSHTLSTMKYLSTEYRRISNNSLHLDLKNENSSQSELTPGDSDINLVTPQHTLTVLLGLFSFCSNQLLSFLSSFSPTFIVHYLSEMGWLNLSPQAPTFFNMPFTISPSTNPIKETFISCSFLAKVIEFFIFINNTELLQNLLSDTTINNITTACKMILEALKKIIPKIFSELRSFLKSSPCFLEFSVPLPTLPPLEIFGHLVFNCGYFLYINKPESEKDSVSTEQLFFSSIITALSCTYSVSSFSKFFNQMKNLLMVVSIRHTSNFKVSFKLFSSTFKDHLNKSSVNRLWNTLYLLICSIASSNPYFPFSFSIDPKYSEKLNFPFVMSALDAWFLMLPKISVYWGVNLSYFPDLLRRFNVLLTDISMKEILNLLKSTFCLSIDIFTSNHFNPKFLMEMYPHQLIFKLLVSVYAVKDSHLLSIEINSLANSIHNDYDTQSTLRQLLIRFLHVPLCDSLKFSKFYHSITAKYNRECFENLLSLWSTTHNFHFNDGSEMSKLLEFSNSLLSLKGCPNISPYKNCISESSLLDQPYLQSPSKEQDLLMNSFRLLYENFQRGTFENEIVAYTLLLFTSSGLPIDFCLQMWNEPFVMHSISHHLDSRFFNFSNNTKEQSLKNFTDYLSFFFHPASTDEKLVEKYIHYIKNHANDQDFENGSFILILAIHHLMYHALITNSTIGDYVGLVSSHKIKIWIRLIDSSILEKGV